MGQAWLGAALETIKRSAKVVAGRKERTPQSKASRAPSPGKDTPTLDRNC